MGACQLCGVSPSQIFGKAMSTRRNLRLGKGNVNTRKKFKRKTDSNDDDEEEDEEEGRPYYVDEDPQVEPTRGELEESCFTTDTATRSQIDRLPRENIHTDTKNEFDVKRDECVEAVREIMEGCDKSGKKFFDPTFYFDKQENLFPPGTPDDCTVGLPEKCVRLSELFGEDCEVFVEAKDGEDDDPVDASDIVQGSIGDCFLIGAISGIAAHGAKVSHFWDKQDNGEADDNEEVEHEAPIERLLVAYDVNAGVYGVMFFKMGQWEWVIIDDLIPVSPEDSTTPLFANCKVGDMELWPMVLEKAYAKLHCNWDAIDGGLSGQAVKDMTGGIMQNLDLSGNDKKYSWNAFLRQAQDSLTVMGCGCGEHVEEEEGEGQCGEARGVYGLIKGHAYTVLSAYSSEGGKVKLVKVRNPWGNEAEWEGDWSDKSEMWDKYPDIAKAVRFEAKDDGTFWISWKDFKYYLGCVEIVRFFPGSWRIMTHYGKASANERDNTFIVHVAQAEDPAAKAVFVLGQTDSRCAHCILDDPASEEAHSIQKSGGTWEGTVSERIGLEVAYLGKNQPPSKIQKLKKLKSVLPNGKASSEECDEVVWVDQRKLKVGYYMVSVTDMEEGIDYYLRVHFNPEGELSSWHLPKGQKSALGFSKFEVEEDEEEEEDEDPRFGVRNQVAYRYAEEFEKDGQMLRVYTDLLPAQAVYSSFVQFGLRRVLLLLVRTVQAVKMLPNHCKIQRWQLHLSQLPAFDVSTVLQAGEDWRQLQAAWPPDLRPGGRFNDLGQRAAEEASQLAKIFRQSLPKVGPLRVRLACLSHVQCSRLHWDDVPLRLISSAGVEQNASLRLKLEELDGIMGRLDARTAVKLEEDDIDPDAGIYESCVRSLPKFEPLTCAGCERAERAERGHLDFQPPELKPRGVLPAHIQEEVNWRRQHTEVLHEQISSLERQRALWEEKVRQLRGESCTSQPNKMAHLRPKSPKAQPEETRPPRQGHAFALLANEPDIASLLQNATARDVFAKLQNPQALRPIQLRQPGQVSTPELLQADVAQQRAEEARVEQQELAAAELLAKRQEMSEALQRELQDMRIMEAQRQRKREQMRAQLQEELEGQLSEERKAWLVQQTQQERERQKQSQKRRLVHQELLQVELERLKDKVALKRTFQAPSAEPDCTERLEELRQVRLETDQCSRVIASASSSPLPSPLPLQVPTSTLEHGLVPRAVEVDFGEPDIAAVLETKEVGAWNLSLDAWLLYYADLLNGKSRDKVADVEVLERTFHALSFGKDRLDSETCRRALSSSLAEVAKDMLSYWVMRVQSEVAGETEKEEMPTWHKEEKGRATPPQQQRTSFEAAQQSQQEASPEEAGKIGARKSAQPQQQTSSKHAQLVQQEAFSQEAGKRSNKANDSHNGKLANKQKASELTKSLYAKQADKEAQPVAQASAQQPPQTSLKDAEAPRQEAGKIGPSKADDSQTDKLATKQKASELTKSLYAKHADKEAQPAAHASAQQPPQTSLKDAEAPRQEAGKIKPSTADDSQNDKLATKQKASELTKSLYAKHADKEAQPAAHASAQPQQQTSWKDAHLARQQALPQDTDQRGSNREGR
ncbi:unnamed protein product [Effrenium voratum]|uniref:Calpain catalytic domain-containing protein n=1 Tax=Effrenium voratum TaxID=2562239 RepID=A0AA36N1P1_9DINO|nr:unnamed protein product [Effrenium voratum]